ncbi:MULTISPECIES: DUF4112 domain-containing protein [unclassified Hyphomonas]|jgi:hypothetical protein|uniref:DUF4112 domain-containing protein n=1 Tax=unclassified Hyphomonas TaxID=2630699 RepID=UPI000458BC6A|nr:MULTISPECIES: DUF4112 domain-containing protein [unclassified Hyphomonas]MAN90483.1 DUF4112 domain-containing protein [Hyphomonadaceae bacterium]KCZ61482.1 hypothetical protein L53_14105 [Hyphomonas sp. L-53-1-40]MAA81574.1 DUF4112 domain-containing protein [Hyphomonas sp.]MAL43939.1 DUF4112 domain-containing protein [Hyphomonas sp.]MAX84327.1 DUF4112 domain-containing protein [Hyphomonas sp.]|tara:strand:+ start:6286 stop:6714 length:429 start_codon:yes stop_codon:yes gene_type:complete
MPSRISQEEAESLHLPNGRTVADEIAGFDRFSDLMDTRFRIAGVPFGLDSLLGIIPVAGDAVTGAAGLYALGTAARLKLPITAHIHIIWNLVVDVVLGSVPLAGDVFDFFFRSHRKNFRVVEKHLIKRAKRHHKDMAKRLDA